MTDILLDLIYCFAASLFFALIMNTPKNTLMHTSIVASIGYLIYLSCSAQLNTTLGFFAGTTFVAMMGEIFARRFKMPATIFIFPAIIPIVPGLGLYETMLAFVQNDILSALEIGADTIFNIVSMAIAMALVSAAAIKMKSGKMN
ncbi:MAG: threonine/serine exporter family protein [Bacillota bacterium]|jgi:uncharacterized membrane protein YjjB (DUF3815 family)|nr:threonine/serine exporter family protein [Bacillota bacterium]NLL59844.1 threonine/serine exporter [Tissierellia bacterium]